MQVQDLLPGVPIVESPLFEQVASAKGWNEETSRVARELHEKGFAELDFPDPDFDDVAEGIKRRLHERYDWAQWRRHGWAQNAGMRLQDAWKLDDAVKRIACNQHILSLLSAIYGRRAWPFQTLNFPVSTQQHVHSDCVHFSSIPERFMCGVWVALENVREDAGPLLYYPGSHRWPILYNEMIGFRVGRSDGAIDQSIYEQTWRALVEASKIEARYFTPKKGRALVWSANLLHGGSRQKNPEITRWSQVTHYFFDSCAYFTPMLSNTYLGQLAVRELTDISTGKPIRNIYVDRLLADVRNMRDGWTATDSGILNEISSALRSMFTRRPGSHQTSNLPADFDPKRYLELHQDLREANADPKSHYLLHGRTEGRRYR